jgi:VWFA-related protein
MVTVQQRAHRASSCVVPMTGAAILLSALAAVAGSPQDRAEIAIREGVARKVYITATDAKGAPVTDLSVQEVTVKEDGRTREILKVGPASEPMQIVLLVDDSGPGIQHIRVAVGEFIAIVRPQAEIAIISTAGQNTVLADFTSDAGDLLGAVRRLATRTTSGGYVLDAIQESARTLQRRQASRPVIVVLSLEGTEFSSVSADRVLDDVRRSNAVVHVLSVGKPTLKTMTPWNQRPTQSIHDSLDETMTRGTVFVEAPRRSGGRHEQIVEPTGIPARLSEIARELRDQLAVTYARPPASKPGQKIDVSVTRRGVKLRAPKQVG